MVQVKNLVVKYGDFTAVDNISFNIKSGQVFAFLGTNGAGKTTTISVLLNLKKKFSGKLLFNNLDWDENLAEIKSKTAVVFQNSVLDGLLTVKENLQTRAELYELSKKEIKENLNNLVEKLELGDILNKRYNKLSGGQKRKVDVAKALMSNPSFLILDEPTTGLDPRTRKVLWNTIREMQKTKNITVLLTTHYMEETKDADNVVIIHKGKILAEGTPTQLKDKYAYDELKLFFETDKLLKLENALNEYGIKYSVNQEAITCKLKYNNDIINLLSKIKNHLTSFELIKGDMDTVFLNVTGEKTTEI